MRGSYIDGETAIIGSMNLDPRSEHTNNEVGVIVHSREVTQRTLSVFNTDRNVDYEGELSADGASLAWGSRSGSREEREIAEPGAGLLAAAEKRRLMWMLVPEDLQ